MKRNRVLHDGFNRYRHRSRIFAHAENHLAESYFFEMKRLIFLTYSFSVLITISADISPFTPEKYRPKDADIAADNAHRESQCPPTAIAILPTTTPPAPPSYHRPPANVPPPRNALTTTVLTTPKNPIDQKPKSLPDSPPYRKRSE